ncbi:MAG: competence/damage-inducible protein A [Candidatus Omnitrophota bacterium]
MNAEILNIGTELLLGYTIDINSAYLSQKLSTIGIDVFYRITVGDNKKRILAALEIARSRADIIITNGGLGPTVDDITLDVISKFTSKKLIFNKDIVENIEHHFKNRNIVMPECNRRQAYIPEGALIIKNSVGTAPGIILKNNNVILIALPGPPSEMRPMVDNFVIPYLKKEFGLNTIIKSKTIKIVGLPESKVNEKVKDVLKRKPPTTVGIYAHPYQIDLRITTKAQTEQNADKNIKKIERILKSRLKGYIFGYDNETLEEVVGKLLLKNKKTISIAESCTGGLLSNRITDISGSSQYFKLGAVVYSNESKIRDLGVSKEILWKYGAVSKETARALAENIRIKGKTDIGLGITGIAGPTGATKTKSVGLVYIGLSTPRKTVCKKYNFIGDRLTIKLKSTDAALEMVRRLLTKS